MSDNLHTTEELTKHSLMLGQIAGETEEWCSDPHCTTLSAVRLMKAELYELRADRLRQLVDCQIQNNYAP